MKIYLLLLFTSLSWPAKASQQEVKDTISNWQVTYRKAFILKSNSTQATQRIVITKGRVSARDTLYIKYSDDTPCSSCQSSLTIKNEKGKVLQTLYGTNELNSFYIKTTELQVMEQKHQTEVLYFYYKEDKDDSPTLLFEFQIK